MKILQVLPFGFVLVDSAGRVVHEYTEDETLVDTWIKQGAEPTWWIPPHMPVHEGFVYFVRAGLDGPVKIGFARDVKKRLKSLRTGNPQPLMLLFSFPGTRSEETALHVKFREFRLEGEWFRPVAEILNFNR